MTLVTDKQIFIVIPTIRNLTFLKSWGSEFKNCQGIIIEDHPVQEIASPKEYFHHVFHYTWRDIKRDFGKDEWIFSRRNAGIRSYGFYKAYNLGADVIITLDDDCYPVKDPVILACPESETNTDPGFGRSVDLTRMTVKKTFTEQHLDNLNFKS